MSFTRTFVRTVSLLRSGLLTGVHVPVHGVIENTVKPYKTGLTVFPDVLQELGYCQSAYTPFRAPYLVLDFSWNWWGFQIYQIGPYLLP